MTSPIRVETGSDPALAVVTIDHPPLNLYDRDLHTALAEAVTRLETQKPRGALFRAEGKVVSGGVDVRDSFLPIFQNADVEAGTRYFAELVELGERVHRLPFPTVFAAHGLTLTWAFELALACDLIIAAESASFGLIEATVGLTPAMGGTQRLAQRVGQGRAKYFVMTAGRFGAAEMERWGGVDRVVPDGELDATARSLARDLAAGPTTAHAATKEILASLAADGLDVANSRTAGIAGKLFATDDLRGAMDSFVERGHGKATFRGA
ncbi:enoyl-CoA hydratase/isomerase family protein [Actinomycetospora sp. OC33-EN08]|uniref:Enoyl-CoA hydratase/isomerase family protein n=1 Tax=Actinomycetospora aurantiaca TaxID=3129233 RepID=A0ABU8MH06_9PSEU